MSYSLSTYQCWWSWNSHTDFWDLAHKTVLFCSKLMERLLAGNWQNWPTVTFEKSTVMALRSSISINGNLNTHTKSTIRTMTSCNIFFSILQIMKNNYNCIFPWNKDLMDGRFIYVPLKCNPFFDFWSNTVEIHCIKTASWRAGALMSLYWACFQSDLCNCCLAARRPAGERLPQLTCTADSFSRVWGPYLSPLLHLLPVTCWLHQCVKLWNG